MKEININIEGYNVNGICVGCLNYNRQMFYREEVKECFKLIGDIDVPDGLSIQVCWECLAAVQNVCRFQSQILKSFDILINYSREHTFLNSPSDFTKHASTRLSICNGDSEYILLTPKLDEELKDELKIKTEDSDVCSVEVEVLKTELETEFDQANDTNFAEDLSQDHDLSSEDDLQLSKLKEKKQKVKKKRSGKKNGEKIKSKEKIKEPLRKLKNMPEDLVEVYTMSEKEMWVVRAEDRCGESFTRLKYKCDSCLISFNTEKLRSEHMYSKHRMKSEDCLQCDVCQAYFLTKDHLSAHRSLHLTAYKCRQCDHHTSLRGAMRRHVAEHQEEEFRCTACDKAFSTRSKLSYHRSKHHKEKLQCDCCGKVFASKMTLMYHLKLLNQNKEDKPKEKLFIPCKGCSKVFHSKKSYRAHVVIHNGLTYPCPICGKLFQWKRNLARHTRNHRERDAGATHECRECGKSFSSRDCYNNHMRLSKRHVPDHAYIHECNYCGKKFATKWCMVDHIDWDHLKRIKYQCSVCFKPFKTAKIMVAHMNNIHDGKKNEEPDGEHLCEICGKSYKTVKRLKGHVWAMHTNRSTTKSYKCKLCPATFTWQTSIYKHMKMMHENKRTKQPRPNPVKKPDPYPDIDLANRMQYFQQNIASNLQNIAHTVQPISVGVVQVPHIV